MRIRYAARSDVGMKRGHNEDYFHVLDEEHLFIVADGMGGHSSGEVASRMAATTIDEFFRRTQDDEATWPYRMNPADGGYIENRLIVGIRRANHVIFEAASHDLRYKGMGTTIVIAQVAGEHVYVAHVGDSRVYRFRAGKLEQLTDDHSLLNDYIKMKRLTEEEIANFPHKNVIVRALGMKDTVKVDTRFEIPQLNDTYLLCSDGLSGPVTDAEIAEIIGKYSDIKMIGSKLIERANENGGPDNVTTVLVRWSQ